MENFEQGFKDAAMAIGLIKGSIKRKMEDDKIEITSEIFLRIGRILEKAESEVKKYENLVTANREE